MIDFEKAIKIANENLSKLVPDARNIALEAVEISDDNGVYEVGLSYDQHGDDLLDISGDSRKSDLGRIFGMMAYRRKYKIFLVGKDGKFKGFRNINK